MLHATTLSIRQTEPNGSGIRTLRLWVHSRAVAKNKQLI